MTFAFCPRRFILILFSLFVFGFNSHAQPWTKAPFLNKPIEQANFFEIRDAFYLWKGDRPIERARGMKQFMRWQWLNEGRSFPDGKIPHTAQYLEAYHQAIADLPIEFKSMNATANWVPFGIWEWNNGYSGYNPGNGRINVIAVSPSDPQTIYIGSASGGVWKTTNGGLSWNTNYDQQAQLGISSIVFHPVNGNILVGTGDRDAFDTESIGILKSTDGGTTWINGGMNYGINSNTINQIIYNPQNENTILVATNSGVYRSFNGGVSWDHPYSARTMRCIAYKPGDTTIVYASGDYFIRSIDGGNSFAVVPNTPNDTCRIELAVTPADPNRVYLLCSNAYSSYGGLYLSTNSGSTFSMQSNSPNILGYSEIGDDNSGQGWYDLAIAASPSNPNQLFIGGVNVWRSDDAGQHWINTSQWTFNQDHYTHADIHHLSFQQGKLWCGSDGGIFVSDDLGDTWTDLSAGLGITQFYRLGCSEFDGDIIVAGAQDNGSNLFQNGSWTHIFGADGFEAIADPYDPDILFCSWQGGGMLKSEDGGVNLIDISPSTDGDWVTPFVMHPADNNMIVAAYKQVFQSWDGGISWNPISDELVSGTNLNHIALAPSNTNYIYVSQASKIFVTTDGGLNWTYYLPSSFYVKGMVVDPYDPTHMWYCGTSSTGDRVFETFDAGDHFTNITGNLSGLGLTCIAFQKDANESLYVGTSTGVFYKDSSMTSWIPFDNGMPKVMVSELEMNYKSNKLRAATYGRGIWETDPYIASGMRDNLINGISIFPNPADDICTIAIDEPGAVINVSLFDPVGRFVQQTSSLNGKVELDLKQLDSGTYYLRINTGKSIFVKPLVIQH